MIKIIKAVPLEKNRLKLFFSDGRSGICDITDLIHGAVFKPLSEPSFFNHVAIDDAGAVFWPNGADICPDLLYKMTLSQSQANRDLESPGQKISFSRSAPHDR